MKSRGESGLKEASLPCLPQIRSGDLPGDLRQLPGVDQTLLITMLHLSENAKDTLCRNVTIYGRCRYEDKGIDDF
jgi:hypothetical protein